MSHKLTPLSPCTAFSSCGAMNMVWLLCLLSLLPSSTESMEFLALHDPSTVLDHVGIQVETQHLDSVSKSVLTAELWLRNHVLPYYPSTNITTIVVGHCDFDTLTLPSINNIHYSLTRWGLQNNIKVAVSLSPQCLGSIYEKIIKFKPLGSPIVLSDETFLQNLGFSHTNATILILKPKPIKRKLLFVDVSQSKLTFPPRPTPVFSPSHSPSNPDYAAGTPLPPLVGTVAPPPLVGTVTPPPSISPAIPESPPFLPHLAPMGATPPYGPHIPPCEPPHGGAPAAGGHQAFWCVAKPSVPTETLQEALDYACGEGSADCEAIQSEGSCHYPDSLVAHASYAFNSYWQRTKRNGGTCGFGGTAMLISSDPSYGHCKFIIS